ncbi:DUF3592 domain-containing protein [Marinobacter sp. AL4B]|uniref:DUF3592 domain-containing protein n=1 Tax=Marinobacter sp. AL4B TaxID=2871173 RepID=UPI001CAA492A|nr:DUF3592 domain-containing protein [Marinobacter sp. AL4B]MBZ0334217.1 DUF3592 domain-containing protein [Marinobacter sp. AL4B]
MKTIKVIKYVFSIVGAALLVGAIILYNNTTSFLERSETAQGTVVELIRSRSSDSTSYYPVVRFTAAEGQPIEFRSNSGSNPPSYNRGEQVTVFYEPANPQDAMIDGFFSLWGGAVIAGILGSVFGLIGGGMVLRGVIKGRSKAYLQKNGVEVHASFQRVEQNTSLTVNGRNPFRIVCQWQHPQTRELHVFRSDNLWFDPTDHISQEKIPVLVDEGNLKRYWVDTSFLPKLAG